MRLIATTLLCVVALLVTFDAASQAKNEAVQPSQIKTLQTQTQRQGGSAGLSGGQKADRTMMSADAKSPATVSSDQRTTRALIVAPSRQSSESRAASSYDIPWQSINAGGRPSSSASYAVNASVGQSVIGSAASASYAVGAGYWYGTPGGGGCDCPFQADFDANSVLDPLDLNGLIDALFFAGPNPQDPACPTTRGDFNNDGAPDPLDLNDLIDHLFFAGPSPVNPCAP